MEEIKINENKNLFQLYQIIPHKEQINSISIFPNGNIISVSRDRSIQIYDSNFVLILVNNSPFQDDAFVLALFKYLKALL